MNGLVSTEWLSDRLLMGSLRIFDCTMYKQEGQVGVSSLTSGRQHWQQSHIPGALYLDMFEHLSAPRQNLPYNLPSQASISDVLRNAGVGPETIVVLYGDGYFSAVTRAWWVLRASGVEDVRILDGGWSRWIEEGRTVTAAISELPPGSFNGYINSSLIAGKADVLNALNDRSVVLINALSREQHSGRAGANFGRPGRIPGSLNIPVTDLIHAETGLLKPVEHLEERFRAGGLDKDQKIVAYCGGGISATTLLFALQLAGYRYVALYDGSLMEWAINPTLPMVTD